MKVRLPSLLTKRKHLYSLINDLPTVFEVVAERKPIKDKLSADSGSKPRGSIKRTVDVQVKTTAMPADESCSEDEEEHGETLCGRCDGNYNANEFWIGCDICERWFHGFASVKDDDSGLCVHDILVEFAKKDSSAYRDCSHNLMIAMKEKFYLRVRGQRCAFVKEDLPCTRYQQLC
ncbi:PHD finger protein ALFIN-LIKE 2 [Capsicum annuum]|nr:PHD finger protein ALFIN-LIKE 2 [Capsicum annuum]